MGAFGWYFWSQGAASGGAVTTGLGAALVIGQATAAERLVGGQGVVGGGVSGGLSRLVVRPGIVACGFGFLFHGGKLLSLGFVEARVNALEKHVYHFC